MALLRNLSAYIIIFFYILPITLIISGCINFQVMIPGTYIKEINTPINGNENIIKILNYYNSFEDKPIIRFEELRRPIIITEEQVNADWLARAAVAPVFCRVTINTKYYRDYDRLKLTLIHEINHCFGFEHVNDPKDIMYFEENDLTDIDSIPKYAKMIKRMMYDI